MSSRRGLYSVQPLKDEGRKGSKEASERTDDEEATTEEVVMIDVFSAENVTFG